MSAESAWLVRARHDPLDTRFSVEPDPSVPLLILEALISTWNGRIPDVVQDETSDVEHTQVLPVITSDAVARGAKACCGGSSSGSSPSPSSHSASVASVAR